MDSSAIEVNAASRVITIKTEIFEKMIAITNIPGAQVFTITIKASAGGVDAEDKRFTVTIYEPKTP